MARRRPPRQPSRPLGGVAPPEERQWHSGREYWVRKVPGANARKRYVCPWCEDGVAVGEPHVVVWPAVGDGGMAERRHWHTRCWQRSR